MNCFYADTFVLPLPTGHRFPITKYGLLRAKVAASTIALPHELRLPEAATDPELLRVHTADYVSKVVNGTLDEREVRRIGLPWSAGLVERSRRAAGATISAARAALGAGIAANLAGGTHHAFAEHGEGFCVFNDAVIAARALQAEGLIRRVVVIDCDVHQGNGTAALCREDPTIFTFSIHAAKNYPFRKEPSDLDIDLPDDTGDAAYLAELEPALHESLYAAQADLAIYLAGADPFVGDTLGRLSLSKAGLLARDRMVFEACAALRLPVAVTMAGGYAKEIQDTVDIQFATLELAAGYAG